MAQFCVQPDVDDHEHSLLDVHEASFGPWHCVLHVPSITSQPEILLHSVVFSSWAQPVWQLPSCHMHADVAAHESLACTEVHACPHFELTRSHWQRLEFVHWSRDGKAALHLVTHLLFSTSQFGCDVHDSPAGRCSHEATQAELDDEYMHCSSASHAAAVE